MTKLAQYSGRGASLVGYAFTLWRACRGISVLASISSGGIIVPLLWLGCGTIGAYVVNYIIIKPNSEIEKKLGGYEKGHKKDETQLKH